MTVSRVLHTTEPEREREPSKDKFVNAYGRVVRIVEKRHRVTPFVEDWGGERGLHLSATERRRGMKEVRGDSIGFCSPGEARWSFSPRTSLRLRCTLVARAMGDKVWSRGQSLGERALPGKRHKPQQASKQPPSKQAGKPQLVQGTTALGSLSPEVEVV